MMRTTTSQVVPVDGYLAQLPSKGMAAGVLFRDAAGRVLLVEPSYKPNWEIPGGVVEADEAPWETAAREVREEIGLDRPIGHLLVIDHLPASDGRPERLLHVYDGGLLDDTDVAGMICTDGEVVSVGFYTLDEVRKRVKPVLAERLAAALQAADQGVTAKCKEGRRVGCESQLRALPVIP